MPMAEQLRTGGGCNFRDQGFIAGQGLAQKARPTLAP
jgi:hypothetical protein